MKIHGKASALIEGLQEYLKERKLPILQVARIADAIYSELYDLFETWDIVDDFQYYLQEADHVLKRAASDTSWVDLPFHLHTHLDEESECTDEAYESYREAAAYFRSKYGKALAEENPEWNEVLMYLCRFSENMRMLLEVLEHERSQQIPGVQKMLNTVISVRVKKR